MTISNECLSLFRTLTIQYGHQGKELDLDFDKINARISELYLILKETPKAFKDDRVLSFLSSSALILQEKNPYFSICSKAFLVAYQKKTHVLDSMIDSDLNIISNLSSWQQGEDNSESSCSSSYSPFFIELQMAVNARERKTMKKDKDTKSINTFK